MKNLWEHSCAERYEAARFSGTASADLVVIGGGFTGCSAALKAAQMGAKVILLEAETIGFGGSGRNVGLVNAGLWLPPDQVEAQMGRAAGQRLNGILAAAPDRVFQLIADHGIACEATRNGTLHCAHAPRGLKELQMRLAQQQKRNAPVTLITAEEAQQAVGSARVYGALRDTRAGTIQPLAYVKGLARAAAEAGARIHEGSPVQALQSDGQGWKVSCASGSISAAAVLVAGNAYAHAAAASVTPATPIVNYFQLATAPMPTALQERILPAGEGCWDTGLIMKSFRRDAAGRLIFGAMGLPDRLGIHRRWAEKMLTRMFPELGDLALEHFWSGRIAMTGDHLPKILNFGPKGLAIFGYSGRGIGPGTVFGQAAAESLLGDNCDDLPVQPIQTHHEAVPQLRSLYYESGARFLHLLHR